MRPGHGFSQMRVDCLHHAGRVVRPRDCQYGRVGLSYQILLEAQTTGNDDFAILGQRLADGVQRFLDRGVDEAAGVDDDEVGAGVGGRGGVALGAQLREDALGVDERLGTA